MRRASNPLRSPANTSLWLIQALSASIVALAIVIVFVASGFAYTQRGASPPRAVLDKPRHDFGETFAGEDLSHAFWVRNLGTSVLELSDRPLLTTRPAKAVGAAAIRQTALKQLAVKAAASAHPPPT